MTGAGDSRDLALRAALESLADAAEPIGVPTGWPNALVRRSRRFRRIRGLGVAAAAMAAVVTAALLVPATVGHHAAPTDITVVPGPHPAKGSIVGRWQVPNGQASYAGVGGSLWLSSEGLILELDAKTLRERQSILGAAGAVALAEGSRQVAVAGPVPGMPGGDFSWYDTASGAQLGQLSLDLPPAAQAPTSDIRRDSALAAFGSVWVTVGNSRFVDRLSLPAGKVTDRVQVGPVIGSVPLETQLSGSGTSMSNRLGEARCRCGIRPMTATSNAVWVGNGGGTVSRIDPLTNRETMRIRVGSADVTDVSAAPDGNIWTTLRGVDAVFPIRPDGTVGTPIKTDAWPTAVVWFKDSLWVACTQARTLERLDTVTGRPSWRVALSGTPDTLLKAGGRLLVSDVEHARLLVVDVRR